MTDALPLFEALLDGHFGPLQEMGYRRTNVAIATTPALGEHIGAEYAHRSYDRLVDVYFGTGSQVVIVTHLSTSTDTTSLKEYLNHIGHPVDRTFGVIDPAGELEPQMAHILAETAKLLLQFASQVLDGTRWVHVPFDWGDYK